MLRQFRKITIKAVLVSVIIGSPAWAMARGLKRFIERIGEGMEDQIRNGAAARAAREFTEGAAARVKQYLEANAKEAERKLKQNAQRRAQLDHDIKYGNDEQRDRAHKALVALDKEDAQIKANEESNNNRWQNIGADVTKLAVDGYGKAFNLGLEMLKEEQRAQKRLEEQAVNAELQKQRDIEKARIDAAAQQQMLQQKLDYLRNPQNIKYIALGATGIAVGVFGAKYGLALAADYLKHLYRNPELAEETSLQSTSEYITDFLLGTKVVTDKVTDVVLNPELRARIDQLAEATKQTVKNNTYFRNILFYGPPGTGKTMLAKKIARSSGLHYIYFSASDLKKLSQEEALRKLSELFDFAKKSTRKLMIIIDEVENLFAKRGDASGKANEKVDEKTKEMLTMLLTRFGTETKDYLVVGITNRPQDLERAVFNRMDEQIEIPAPSLVERELIIKKYITDYLTPAPKVEKRKWSFIGHIYNYAHSAYKYLRPDPVTPTITIAPDALDEKMLSNLLTKTDGFVGRDLSKLVLALQLMALTSKDRVLTPDMVNLVLKQKIDALEREKAGFKGF